MSLFRGKLFAGALFAGALFGPSPQTPEPPVVSYGANFYEDGFEAKKVAVKPIRNRKDEEEAVIMAIVQFVLEQS